MDFRPLPTPNEMIAYLDRFVRGQSRAKRDLAVSIYNHYLSLAYRDRLRREGQEVGAALEDFGKQHVLLLGPTGSGKTYLTKLLAQFVGVPFSMASATALVQTGYVGMRMEEMLGTVLQRAKGDLYLAQRAIVFVDEIDKIRSSATSGGPDVSGEGVQNALLTLLDGRVMTVEVRRQGANEVQKLEFDTSNLLFICSGAFVDLRAIVERRTTRSGALGFGSGRAAAAAEPEDGWLGRVQTEDLVEFGLIPEFVGRFSTVTHSNELSVDDLAAILVDSEGSILRKLVRQFALHDVELVFPEDARREIAATAKRLKIGARGLQRLVLGALDSVDYRLPELAAQGVGRITITVDTVRGRGEPLIEMRAAPRTQVPLAEVLRKEGLLPPHKDGATGQMSSAPSAEISNTAGWTEADIRARIEVVRDQLDWKNTTGSARKWWEAFEQENRVRLPLVLRLAEELLARKATVTEFFLAYVYSNTDNIQANIHYLDYTRLKKEEERKKREAKAAEAPSDKPPAAPAAADKTPSGKQGEPTDSDREDEGGNDNQPGPKKKK